MYGALCLDHNPPSCSRCQQLGWSLSQCCRVRQEGHAWQGKPTAPGPPGTRCCSRRYTRRGQRRCQPRGAWAPKRDRRSGHDARPHDDWACAPPNPPAPEDQPARQCARRTSGTTPSAARCRGSRGPVRGGTAHGRICPPSLAVAAPRRPAPTPSAMAMPNLPSREAPHRNNPLWGGGGGRGPTGGKRCLIAPGRYSAHLQCPARKPRAAEGGGGGANPEEASAGQGPGVRQPPSPSTASPEGIRRTHSGAHSSPAGPGGGGGDLIQKQTNANQR